MSRCFPYPPPGYQRIADPPAIGSIKLQNDPKQDKKRNEKKRDKKEKRERGDKSRKHHRDSEKVEPVDKKRKYDNGSELCEKKINPKADKFVIEQLENSGISEEHGLPSSILEPCESSESTQNSSKSRKLERDAGVAPRSHGISLLRIKLPLQKHKVPDPVPSSEAPILGCKDPQPVPSKDLMCRQQNVPEYAPANEEPCFSGRFVEASMEKEKPEAAAGESGFSESKREKEKPEAAAGDSGFSESKREKEKHEAAHGHSGARKSKRSRRSEKMLRQFTDLMSNWKPAQLQGLETVDDDDQGWLSARQQNKDPGSRSHGLDLSHKKGGAASYQPRAYFMPEFDAYQMPYVIPF